MIFGLFRRPQENAHARATYSAIVAQARQPLLYSAYGVPDTVEGRYEMIMLHCFLYLHRLKTEPEDTRAKGQEVFDLMFLEMDRALREMGVGDLSVPKKIKKMAGAFYGRTAAYDDALGGASGDLAVVLVRNISPDGGLAADALADYVRAAVSELERQTVAALDTAPPRFPDPLSFAPGGAIS
jgi:cytochrome b pre-mRNA-processing protein 3